MCHNYHGDYFKDELDQQTVNEKDCVDICISNNVYENKLPENNI